MRSVSLRANYIGDAGAGRLAEGISHNTGLEKMNLHSNDFASAGERALLRAVEGHPQLRGIADAGGSELFNEVCSVS